MRTIEEDMDSLMMRVEYGKLLADHSKPLPLPFEQWKRQQVITNPQTFKDMGEEL